MGAAVRQGPHQAAQKSTSTGTSDACTMSVNVCPSTSSGSAIGGNVALQAPQRAVFDACRGRTRFLAPHAGHVRIIEVRILPSPCRARSGLARSKLWEPARRDV
jgi:hypothetical protein